MANIQESQDVYFTAPPKNSLVRRFKRSMFTHVYRSALFCPSTTKLDHRINQKNTLSVDLQRVVSRETELNRHPDRSSIFTIAPLFHLGPRRIDTFGTNSRATGALKDCVPRRVLPGSTTLAISSLWYLVFPSISIVIAFRQDTMSVQSI